MSETTTRADGERIVAIREYDAPHNYEKQRYSAEAGFQIETTEQVITLAIDDESSCCEHWGYFLTEDDTEKFVGAELRGVRITDTNRSTRQFFRGWGNEPIGGSTGEYDWNDDKQVSVDGGDVLFVDIETDRGVLQFVAYNAHNGYYGHEARVESKQLDHKVYL